MTTPSAPASDKSFIHVEILDFNKEPVLADELATYYKSLDPERAEWPEEKLKRLVVRTECKWGRIPVGDGVVMLNEFAEGPRELLSKSTTATVKFFAELRPSAEGAGDGYIEQAPFCLVAFDDDSCRKLRAQGLVKLEEFIRRTVPHYADVLNEYRSLILSARENLLAIRKRAQKRELEREGSSEGEGQSPGGPRP